MLFVTVSLWAQLGARVRQAFTRAAHTDLTVGASYTAAASLTLELCRLSALWNPVYIMTSFAFIPGVFPLVIAPGAGAGVGARRPIGIAVFSGMLASTCLAVMFVPSFYVVMQRIANEGNATPRRMTRRPRPAWVARLRRPRPRPLEENPVYNVRRNCLGDTPTTRLKTTEN